MNAARILILDLDVHQGDGGAALTAGRDDVFTLSIRAERDYPERKARSIMTLAGIFGEGLLSEVRSREPKVQLQAGIRLDPWC